MKKWIFVLLFCGSVLSFSQQTKTTPGFFKSVASYFKPDERKLYKETQSITKATGGTILIRNHTGSITVKGSEEQKLTIEALIKGPAEKIADTKISTKKTHSEITIETTSKTTEPPLPVSYTVTIPKTMSLIIEQIRGDIVVDTIIGTLTLETDEGSITVTQGAESITARAPNGMVTLDIEKLLPQASIFVETGGKISLALQPQASARLSARSNHGFVSSQLPITLDAITLPSLDKKTWDGLRRCVDGMIGTGDSSIVLNANGSISILDRTAS